MVSVSVPLLCVQVKRLPGEEEIRKLSARELNYIYHRWQPRATHRPDTDRCGDLAVELDMEA